MHKRMCALYARRCAAFVYASPCRYSVSQITRRSCAGIKAVDTLPHSDTKADLSLTWCSGIIVR